MMKSFSMYLLLELKKSIKVLGRTIIGILIMVFFLAIGVTAVSYVFLQSQVFQAIEIAVIIPEDENLTKLAVQYISNMDSVKTVCDFNYMDRASAWEKMESGEVAAVMDFPDKFFDDVMYGENTEATIYFADSEGLALKLFQELLETGVEFIQISEAGVYASLAIDRQYPSRINRSDLGNYVAWYYAEQILHRNKTFNQELLSPFGVYEYGQFYFSSALMIVLLMMGMNFGYLYKKRNRAVVLKLRIYGVKLWQISLVRIFVMGVILEIIALVLYLGTGVVSAILQNGFLIPEFSKVVQLFFLCFSIAAYFHVVYSVAGEVMNGTLMILICNIIMILLSGILLPAAYLPSYVAKIGAFMPLRLWHQYCSAVVFGEGTIVLMAQLLCICVLGIGIGTVGLWKNT